MGDSEPEGISRKEHKEAHRSHRIFLVTFVISVVIRKNWFKR